MPTPSSPVTPIAANPPISPRLPPANSPDTPPNNPEKFSITANAKKYQADIIAGLSIVGLLVPEAVAYANIAGMPARAGLIGLMIGLLVYGIFGKSRFAIVSGTSSSAAVLLATLTSLAPVSLNDKLMLASVVVLGTGLLFILAGLFRLGGLASFIAKPVLRGVTIGLAVVIIVSQLPHILAIHVTQSTVLGKIIGILHQMPAWHIPSLGLGLGAFLVLHFWKSKRQPVMLWVVMVTIALMQCTELGKMGIASVGNITLSQTTRNWGNLVGQEWFHLLQFSMALALVLYAESYSAIRGFAIKYNDDTNNNRDLLGLGAANLLSGALAGLPVGAGFSATSANEAAGATSKISAYVALSGVVLIVTTCLPWLALLPEPVLAAIVIHAVSHGLSFEPISRYFNWQRDRTIVVVTVLAVIFLGILNGLMAAVVFSIVMTLRNFAKTKWAQLGRLDGGHNFVSLKHYPHAETDPQIFVANVGQPLFFANAESILEEIRQAVLKQPFKIVVLSIEESPDFDGTTIEALDTFSQQLVAQHISLYLCRIHSKVHHILKQAKLKNLPQNHLSKLSVDDTVALAKLELASTDQG